MIIAIALVALLAIAAISLLVLDVPANTTAMNVTRALSSDEQIVTETVGVKVAWNSFDEVRAGWADTAEAGTDSDIRKTA